MEHVVFAVYKDAEFYNRRPPAIYPTEYRAPLHLNDVDFDALRRSLDASGKISIGTVKDIDTLQGTQIGAIIDQVNLAMATDRFARSPADRLGNGVFGIRIDLDGKDVGP